MNRHKHADLIHAWADGAEIQWYFNSHTWIDDDAPSWDADTQYRIKPEEKKPVVRWLWAYQNANGIWTQHINFMAQEPEPNSGWVKLEWSQTEFPE